MAYMVKNEVGLTKFWQIRLDKNLLSMNYGNLGTIGQNRVKEFDDQEQALEHLVESVIAKYDAGYRLKSNNKRKLEDQDQQEQFKVTKKVRKSDKDQSGEKLSPKSTSSTNKSQKRGLSGAPAPDVSKPLGYVDPESCVYGTLYRNAQGTIFDAMLLKENQKYDNYYIIQLIENSLFNEYKIFLRWGRVDTAGQCQVLHPRHLKEALTMFEDKFYEKTGIKWNLRYQSPLIDMYEWIKPPRQTNQQIQKIQSYNPIQNFENQQAIKSVKNNQQVGKMQIPTEKLQNQVKQSTSELLQNQYIRSTLNNKNNVQNGQTNCVQQDTEKSDSLGLVQIMNGVLNSLQV